MKKFLFILGGCAIGILLLMLYYTFSRPFAKFNARFKNDIKQEYMIQDATSRIQNYEWFYEQYEAIKSTANKVKLSEGSEKNSIRMILADMISEYNARSRQTMTRANWKSESLPYQVNENDFLEE